MDDSELRLIAIGGSAGAIQAIRQLCRGLKPDIPAAVCIVIHVGARGANLIASMFDEGCPLPFVTAAEGQKLEAGRAYVAPADRHLLVVDGTLRLGSGPRENLARPAIDPLLRSAGFAFGPRSIGVVLTGTLNDGAAGLADLKRCGGVTVVQNPADAEAPEMPLEALKASEVDYRAPLAELGELLATLARLPPGPFLAPPADIELENEIALGRPVGAEDIVRLADPVALSCPACGGVLSQMRRSPPLRFRCQVGHGYTAETLAAEQEGTLDEAMRVALRIVEERASLTERMAEDARKAGMRYSAHSYETKAKESRRHIEVLRDAIGRSQAAP
jgi:two-component system, chemotaxis family, protein-glutamate methylesterase/glutaminase